MLKCGRDQRKNKQMHKVFSDLKVGISKQRKDLLNKMFIKLEKTQKLVELKKKMQDMNDTSVKN